MLNGLPPNNPILAWAVIVASVLVAIVPAIYNRVKENRHKPEATANTPPVTSSEINVAVTSLIANLQQANAVAETRAESADRRADEYAQRNADLRVRLAKAEERIERLTAQVQLLTERLIQRGERGA